MYHFLKFFHLVMMSLYSKFTVVFCRMITTIRADSLRAVAMYLSEDPKQLFAEYGVGVISFLKAIFSFK